MLLSLFDLGCILSLWPKMTLKKRKRKLGDIERIESQLFQKVWVQGDRWGAAKCWLNLHWVKVWERLVQRQGSPHVPELLPTSIIFQPPPELVHPVAIQVDKKVPGKKKYWGEWSLRQGNKDAESNLQLVRFLDLFLRGWLPTYTQPGADEEDEAVLVLHLDHLVLHLDHSFFTLLLTLHLCKSMFNWIGIAT